MFDKIGKKLVARVFVDLESLKIELFPLLKSRYNFFVEGEREGEIVHFQILTLMVIVMF